MEIYAIETGNFMLDGGAMFGVVPKSIWSKVYPCDENNMCNLAMRCMLVVSNERKILIDTGIGNKQDQKFLRHYNLNGNFSLENSLNKHGYSSEDITDVILTHLHFDHCGGCIKYNEKNELVPAFPNATFHTSVQQWKWAITPNYREKASYLKENIEPLEQSGKLKLFDSDCELFPGISVKLFNGHTDGQVIPYIKLKNRTLVYCADFFPSVSHLPISFVVAYDTRPLITIEEHKVFLDEALKNDYILFFEHDLYNECCTLTNTEKGIRAKETFTLESFLRNI
jgi:glyoxylase-like metal-dependent hydrolase (beta-lactamase superfamily II)